MASDLGTYNTNERLMLSLLDMMPDEMVDRLAVSVKKDMPDASAHYSSHPAAGIMTLTLSSSDAHTFFHEFMHHIQTFIAPEDLDGLALQFKRALMAEDTQGLISTLYYSAHTRIKNEAHLRELIRADPDILRAWTDMLGGRMRTLSGEPGTMGRRAPTEADLNAIIAIMQDEGKLPPSFTQAANPSFDIEKYGPWKTDGSTTLGGMFPQEYEIDQLKSMLYRYTNFNEYLAEVFSDRMLVNAAANMLKDEKWLSLFDRIIDLLTDWFIGAHNWAKRHGRKDLVDDIIKRIQRGDFNSVTYDKAQRELERPYNSWLRETGAGGKSVAGSATLNASFTSQTAGGVPWKEVIPGMGGAKLRNTDSLGRIREIEGGEQGGGAFAQSQPPSQAGSIGVATPEERAQMNAYLKKAQEKWGVGPLGNRRLGDAGQELQAPYQPFPVEKTETFLRRPMETVGQEFRTGRLEDPIISKRGIEGVSPDTAPQMRAEGGGDEPWNYLGKTPEDKSAELVDYQLGNLETMVHADIWGAQASDAGATYRFMLEGAGDAFREIAGNGAPDYIEEKVRRILRQFNELPRDMNNLPSEAVASGEKMKEIALAAPVTTPRQKAGVDLIVAVIDRDVEAIKNAAARIRGQQ